MFRSPAASVVEKPPAISSRILFSVGVIDFILGVLASPYGVVKVDRTGIRTLPGMLYSLQQLLQKGDFCEFFEDLAVVSRPGVAKRVNGLTNNEFLGVTPDRNPDTNEIYAGSRFSLQRPTHMPLRFSLQSLTLARPVDDWSLLDNVPVRSLTRICTSAIPRH